MKKLSILIMLFFVGQILPAHRNLTYRKKNEEKKPVKTQTVKEGWSGTIHVD